MKESGTFSYITTESVFLRFIEAVIVSSTAILMCDYKDVTTFDTYNVYVGIYLFLLQKYIATALYLHFGVL